MATPSQSQTTALIESVDALASFVLQHSGDLLDPRCLLSDAEFGELKRLDAAVTAHCHLADLRIDEFEQERMDGFTPFGFSRLLLDRKASVFEPDSKKRGGQFGVQLYPTEEWQHALETLKERARIIGGILSAAEKPEAPIGRSMRHVRADLAQIENMPTSDAAKRNQEPVDGRKVTFGQLYVEVHQYESNRPINQRIADAATSIHGQMFAGQLTGPWEPYQTFGFQIPLSVERFASLVKGRYCFVTPDKLDLIRDEICRVMSSEPEVVNAMSLDEVCNILERGKVPGVLDKAVHNADFTMVNWFGTDYQFALGVQSSAVRALWDEWKKTGLGLHQETIREAIDAERNSFRMDTAFRKHPAFGTMIRPCGDGRYKLAQPGTQSTDPLPSAKEIKRNSKNTPKSPRKRG